MLPVRASWAVQETHAAWERACEFGKTEAETNMQTANRQYQTVAKCNFMPCSMTRQRRELEIATSSLQKHSRTQDSDQHHHART